MEEQEKHIKKKKSLGRRLLKWLLLLLLILLLLLVTLFLVFQIPSVQQWAAEKTATYLSEQWNAEVQVDKFQIKNLDEIELGGVLIRDLERDTMIYAGALLVNLDKPIQRAMQQSFLVEALEINDAFVNIKYLNGHFQNNLNDIFKGPRHAVDSVIAQQQMTTVVDTFSAQDWLHLNAVTLSNVKVRNYHEPKGKEELFYVGEAKLTDVDFNSKALQLMTEEFVADRLYVDIENFDYDLAQYRKLFVEPYEGVNVVVDDSFPMNVTAKKFKVSNSRFSLTHLRRSPIKLTKDDEIDWDHLVVNDVHIEADSFYAKDWLFGLELNHMSAKTSSGFEIVKATSPKIRVTEQGATASNLIIKTPMSTMQGELRFIYKQYPDFQDFPNKVRFDFRSRQSVFGITDLMDLSKGIRTNRFFQENQYGAIKLDGRVLGYVNNLRGRQLNISIGNRFVVNGLIDVKDFTDPEKTRINLDLEEWRTDMQTIRELVPNLGLPSQFDRLGNIRLNGEFNGLLKDFIASGALVTDLGSADFNLNLNFLNGFERAVYDGQLNLNQFDLGRWSDAPELGSITLNASISEGFGLTSASAQGQIRANIANFDFRNYSYQNVDFTGLLKDGFIDGKVTAVDDNMDIDLQGLLAFKDQPKIDVSGRVDFIDLQALNLVKKPLVFSSNLNVDIQDFDPDKFTGSIVLADVGVGASRDSMYRFDTLMISSAYDVDSMKRFQLHSEVIDAQVDGDYRILSLPNYFINYFLNNNPAMANKLGLQRKDGLPPADFTYDIQVYNTGGLLSLVTDQIDTIRDLSLEGWFADSRGFEIKGKTPRLLLKNTSIENLNLFAIAEGEYTNLVTSHDGMKIGKTELSPLTIFGDLEQDTMYYVFNEANYQSLIDNINVEGKVFVHDDLWKTQLYNSSLQIFNEEWSISENNSIEFGKGKLRVRDLDLNHDDQFIKIKSINNDKGLAVALQSLPLSHVNEFVTYDRLLYKGDLSGTISTANLATFEELKADLSSPDFYINGDPYGELSIQAESQGLGTPIEGVVKMEADTQRLELGATVMLPNKANGTKGTIDAAVDIENYRAKIIEYFVLNGLSNTTGFFDGKITANGPLTDPNVKGELHIPNSSFKVDILGTTYYIKEQTVGLTSDRIDLTGAIITDRLGNEARLQGGLTHHNLARLGFDARLVSDEILVLETTKDDNPLFYGNILADISSVFSGTVNEPVIRVNASNKANSTFVINTDNEQTSEGLDFIIFDVDTGALITEDAPIATGVDLTIDMDVNPQLDFKIILDESARDIIQGVGAGDLVFNYSPAGEISLFGDYKIDRGQYLFTYTFGGLLPINKPFRIQRGSTLRWTRDPYDADINITADYQVQAAPYNLVSNQVSGNTAAEEESQQKTEVDLELLLSGSLLSPTINFDIDVPNVAGSVRNAVDIEVDRLRNDQTEMQNQAASLILFGDFASRDISANASVSVVSNTISEWLSSQVSYYLTGLVTEVLKNWEFIDDIEFDVGYRLPSGQFTTAAVVNNGSELGIGARVIMADRRLVASVKGDFINNNTVAGNIPSNYFNTNFEADYILTKDQRWRLRAYSIQDQIQTGRRTRVGLGLRWRREYDDLEEYKKSIQEYAKLNREKRRAKKKTN